MYSFYFQNFTYNTPVNAILPLKNNVQRLTRTITTPNGDIKVYPNPARSEVNIDLPTYGKDKNVTIRIFDTNGQFIQQLILGTTSRMNINSLKAGIYVLEINAGKSKIVERIVKI